MTCPDIRIEVAAQPRLLVNVRDLVRSFASGCGLPADAVDSVVLAVDEACTNAIRHSYGGACDERVELTLRQDPHGIEITLSDRGKPVHPECVFPKPCGDPDPSRVRPGGLGLGLIYSVFDEVLFHPGKERGNTVIMRLIRRPLKDTVQHGA